MNKTSFKVVPKVSLSLSSLLRRQTKKMQPLLASRAIGFTGADEAVVEKKERVSVLLETTDRGKAMKAAGSLDPSESLTQLTPQVWSGFLALDTVQALQKSPAVTRIQSKKEADRHLDAADKEVKVHGATGARAVTETGKDVLIGIVDSGFDLSHPAFRDANGKLRVEGLLDQTTVGAPTAFTAAQLEAGWGNGSNPGRDADGHGTHVAGIAGGTKHKGFEGIAPGARFLLVKTNFRDTADGVAWVFAQAGSKPCVVNMSLGFHWGSHDGTSLDEQVIDQLSGAGKVVVVSAGNEREWRLHIGGQFLPNQQQSLTFDLRRRGLSAPFTALTLWYDPQDAFDVELVTPSGEAVPVPALGNTDSLDSTFFELELARETYTPSNMVQVQIVVSFKTANPPQALLLDWGLRLTCRTAVIGRLDGWFANSGMATFDPHALLEETRTIGMPATARSAIAVASHVSKNAWVSDDGNQSNSSVVVGRISPFSSMGPTRDGRAKPEIAAPGQYLTAALAAGSELEGVRERAQTADRVVTIEGTSMSAPVVAGAVALMLQKKKTLTPAKIVELLRASAVRDAHVATEQWNPSYGHGKLDVKAALDAI